MTLSRSFVLSFLVAGVCHAATQAGPDGLVPVHSSQLDQVHLRPDALAGYRKVLIEPVQVEFARDWTTNAYDRIPPRAIAPQEAKRIAGAAASSVERALAEAFRARGYEIVAAPGPGVLRLSPGVAELFVNAPSAASPSPTWTFTREAGQATLRLEARDAATGALLGRVVHQATAQQMGRLELVDPVTNQFWFDALFRRWAASCAEAFRK